jgi:hypothetical protein
MIFAVPFISGFLFRLRGMHHSWLGTQGARFMFWCIPMALLSYLLFNLPVWAGAVSALAYWLGLIVMPWGKWFDLGHNNGKFWPDFFFLSLRGVFVTAPAGLLIWYFSPLGWVFALCGIMMGVCYALGWKLPTMANWLNRGPELGELIFGSWIGFVLIAITWG